MTRRPRHARRRRDERGVVIPLTAILLVPLLIVSAFAIDLGAWYADASRMQRAADAAALAGVVWMPDQPAAVIAAEAALERNGFVHGRDGVEVDITSPGTRQLTVEITKNGQQWFSQLAIDAPELNRSGTAEYVLPVPLGSPDHRFGNDPLSSPAFQPNLWAAISAPFTFKGQGDIYAIKCGSGQGSGCNQTGNEYDPNGYLYAIEVKPEDVGRTLVVEVYDAGFYRRNSLTHQTGDWDYGSGLGVNTEFELFRADNTPLSHLDNLTRADTQLASTNSCTSSPGRFRIASGESSGTYQGKWATLCRITANRAGQWVLRVRSSGIPGMADWGNGTNQYSLRTSYASSTRRPAIYGLEDISLFNNMSSSGTSSANFFLAEVEQRHAGKTFRISLWDSGDGSGDGTYDLNILLPGGATTTCTYGARGESVQTSSVCSIITRSGSTNQFDAKWLDIDIRIPASYTCNPDCWWKVRYDFTGGAPTDRTVWTAQIVGDPVHLVE